MMYLPSIPCFPAKSLIISGFHIYHIVTRIFCIKELSIESVISTERITCTPSSSFGKVSVRRGGLAENQTARAKSQYKNNNIAFQSQASWGRLELKPTAPSHGSGTSITDFQVLLFKHRSLGISQAFKYLFIVFPCQFRSSSTSPHIISLA